MMDNCKVNWKILEASGKHKRGRRMVASEGVTGILWIVGKSRKGADWKLQECVDIWNQCEQRIFKRFSIVQEYMHSRKVP